MTTGDVNFVGRHCYSWLTAAIVTIWRCTTYPLITIPRRKNLILSSPLFPQSRRATGGARISDQITAFFNLWRFIVARGFLHSLVCRGFVAQIGGETETFFLPVMGGSWGKGSFVVSISDSFSSSSAGDWDGGWKYSSNSSSFPCSSRSVRCSWSILRKPGFFSVGACFFWPVLRILRRIWLAPHIIKSSMNGNSPSKVIFIPYMLFFSCCPSSGR